MKPLFFILNFLLLLVCMHSFPLSAMEKNLALATTVMVSANKEEQNRENKQVKIQIPISKVAGKQDAICCICREQERKATKQIACDHYFCDRDRPKEGESCAGCSPIELPKCAVCQSGIRENKERMLICDHIFHPNCIQKYLDQGGKMCPICRATIKCKHFSRCEFCQGVFVTKVVEEGDAAKFEADIKTVCTVRAWGGWAWWTERIEHCIHDSCLNEFIKTDIRVAGSDGTVYYRINEEGRYYYRCLVHNTQHPLKNDVLEKLNVPLIVPDTTKDPTTEIKALPQPVVEKSSTAEVLENAGLL